MAQIKSLYEDYFLSEIGRSPNFRILPGAPELLSVLGSENRVCLGLATGNFERVAYLKLRRAGLDSYFRFGGFGSDSKNRLELTNRARQRGNDFLGYEIPPQDVWVIGDSAQDILAGKHIGARTLAVATSRTGKEELAKHHPDAVLEDLTDTGQIRTLLLSPSESRHPY